MTLRNLLSSHAAISRNESLSFMLQAVLAEFACTWAFLFITIGVNCISLLKSL